MNKIKIILALLVLVFCLDLILFSHLLQLKHLISTPSVEYQTPEEKKVEPEKPRIVVGTKVTYQNIFNAVNLERTKAGFLPLEHDKLLDKVANDKLQDILKYKYWSHVNPITKISFVDFLVEENYTYTYAGENLACGTLSVDSFTCIKEGIDNYNTMSKLLAAWMNSPTHKSNILSPNYTKTGIAISGTLIVQEFAANE